MIPTRRKVALNRSLAARRNGPAALRHHDEPDLAGTNHSETLSRQPLEVCRVMEERNLPLENSILLLQERRLFLKLGELIALIDVRSKRNDQVEQKCRDDDRENRSA